MREWKDFLLKKGRIKLSFVNEEERTVKEFSTELSSVVLEMSQVFGKNGDEVSAPYIQIMGDDTENGVRFVLEFESWWLDEYVNPEDV